MLGLYIVLGALFLIALIIAKTGFRTVPQSHVMVVERMGKFNRVVQSGLHMILPPLDKPRRVVVTSSVTLDPHRREAKGPTKDRFQDASVVDSSGKLQKRVQYYWSDYVDLREQILDFPKQSVITKDNLTLDVDAVLYYQITDPIKSTYEMENLPLAIEKLTQTTLRSSIGSLELDETLDSRETINNKLREVLDEATDKWGVKVTRVELQDISPPPGFLETMQKQITAERERRAAVIEAEGKKQAAITEAEGEKQAAITKAEGQRQSMILRAEGESQSRILVADAEREAIARINSELGDQTANYLLTQEYIDAIKEAGATDGTNTLFLPFELGNLTDLIKGISGR